MNLIKAWKAKKGKLQVACAAVAEEDKSDNAEMLFMMQRALVMCLWLSQWCCSVAAGLKKDL